MSTEFFRKYIEIIKEAEESTNQQIAKIFARYANNLSKLAGQDGYSEDDIIDLQKTAKAFYQSMELGLKEWRLLHNLIQNPPTIEVMDDLGINLRQEYNKLAGQVNEESETATLAKRHGMEHRLRGNRVELSHPTKGKINVDRYGEWHHQPPGFEYGGKYSPLAHGRYDELANYLKKMSGQ
jgi:hypothetical protein